MSGRPNLLPKLDMGAVKEKDAKVEKERTKFGASMKKLSASIKRGMTPRGRTFSTDLGGEASSTTNSVTGGSPLPGTPQKPDDFANDGLDDLKATIAEAQALVAGDRTPSAPSTPEPADSADSPSHKLVQDAVHSAVAEAEEDAPAPAPALPPPTLSAAADLGANGPVPPPQPAPEAEPSPAPAPPIKSDGLAHAVVEPTEKPGDAVIRVHVAEPAKAPTAEIEPAPVAPQQAPAKRRGLRRHFSPRKVLAVASLAGLAYLAKDPVERHLDHRRQVLAPPTPPPPPPSQKGPFSFVTDLFK